MWYEYQEGGGPLSLHTTAMSKCNSNHQPLWIALDLPTKYVITYSRDEFLRQSTAYTNLYSRCHVNAGDASINMEMKNFEFDRFPAQSYREVQAPKAQAVRQAQAHPGKGIRS